jgi:hypothetical protein
LRRAVPADFEKIAASSSASRVRFFNSFKRRIRQEFGTADCFQPTQTFVGFFCDEADL